MTWLSRENLLSTFLPISETRVLVVAHFRLRPPLTNERPLFTRQCHPVAHLRRTIARAHSQRLTQLHLQTRALTLLRLLLRPQMEGDSFLRMRINTAPFLKSKTFSFAIDNSEAIYGWICSHCRSHYLNKASSTFSFGECSWERRVDQLGRTYYVDHNTRTTTWTRPR